MIVKRLSSAAWAAGLVVSGLACGCTATATAVPAPPASGGCASDPSVACTGGGGGYSCAPGDVPTDGDPSLACSVGVVASGETLYCCVSFASQSSCMPDRTVQGCTGYSYGFSCTGNDSPDQTDSSLVCSQASQGNGALLYCCTG